MQNYISAILKTLAVAFIIFGTVYLVERFSPAAIFCNDRLYQQEISAAALRHGIDPDLVRALIWRESRFDRNCRGRRGECGLMQILPSGAAAGWAKAAKHHTVAESDLYNVTVNLEIGCWYLARGLKEYRDYKNGVQLALAGYNAGPAKAAEWKPATTDGEVVITYPDTAKYVADIVQRYRYYQENKRQNDQ